MKYKEMKDRKIRYYAYWPEGTKKSNIYKVSAIDFFNEMAWLKVGRVEKRVKTKQIKLLQVLGEAKTYGKDVYEGCIVERTYLNGAKYYEAVEWRKRSSYDGSDTIGFQDIASTHEEKLSKNKIKIRVVGNIFENANLLDNEKGV